MNFIKKNNDILVSISCITYNHSLYIKQCIDSLLMQKTNFAFEVLIHDDCSTDGTTEIIKEYEAKYPNIIKALYEEENQYQQGKPSGSAIWNFPRAKGKYIAMCEGDDFWIDPYKLQKQVDFLEKNTNYVLSHTSFKYLIEYENNKLVDSNVSSKKNELIHNTDENNIMSHILNYNEYRIQTTTVLFRTDIYNLVQNDRLKQQEPEFLMGDTPLWVRLCNYGKFKFHEDVTAVYRQHLGSACRERFNTKKLRFTLSCSEMRIYFANLYNISSNSKKKFESAYKKDLFRYMLYDKTFTPIFKPHNNTLEKILLYDLILSKPFLVIIKPLYENFSLQGIKNKLKRIINTFKIICLNHSYFI